MSKFANVPQVRMNRSKFDLSKGIKTSMSVGRLYPIDIQEVLPGDTFKTTLGCVARITTAFIKPIIDNAYMDIFHFFVPYRLCYNDTERVFGNPKPSSYFDNDLAEFPSFPTRQSVATGTIADYLGLSLDGAPSGTSVLPFRAFALIYNNWFRNENTCDEVYVQDGEFSVTENLNAKEWSPNNYTGLPPFVSKKNDYFTSALPSPQKGSPVNLPIGDRAPVFYKGYSDGLRMNYTDPNTGELSSGKLKVSFTRDNYADVLLTANSSLYSLNPIGLTPTNGQFYADLSDATAKNINDIRFAFQLQKMLERDALYGSRYNEYLLGHFGVVSPDSRMQIPEFLGGGRIPISVQQVAQTTSQLEDDMPLASLGAFSLSNGKSRFTKSFVEHGYIITCACIRTMHTYQQGQNKMWSRTSRNDFYDPLFATLGEQPIYTSELYTKGQELKGDVFGYNEAWADYRYAPSRISGQLRTANTKDVVLDMWHFGDYYANKPVLTDTFTNETSTFFDRTISAPSTSIDNFICDFWFNTKAVRVMPLYSVPGLVDHH